MPGVSTPLVEYLNDLTNAPVLGEGATVYVHPTEGSASGARLRRDKPFATGAQATAAAQSGDTIRILPGVHSPAINERWGKPGVYVRVDAGAIVNKTAALTEANYASYVNLFSDETVATFPSLIVNHGQINLDVTAVEDVLAGLPDPDSPAIFRIGKNASNAVIYAGRCSAVVNNSFWDSGQEFVRVLLKSGTGSLELHGDYLTGNVEILGGAFRSRLTYLDRLLYGGVSGVNNLIDAQLLDVLEAGNGTVTLRSNRIGALEHVASSGVLLAQVARYGAGVPAIPVMVNGTGAKTILDGGEFDYNGDDADNSIRAAIWARLGQVILRNMTIRDTGTKGPGATTRGMQQSILLGPENSGVNTLDIFMDNLSVLCDHVDRICVRKTSESNFGDVVRIRGGFYRCGSDAYAFEHEGPAGENPGEERYWRLYDNVHVRTNSLFNPTNQTAEQFIGPGQVIELDDDDIGLL